MNLFTIAILFSGMVGGDSALFVPVSRESGPARGFFATAAMAVGSTAGRLDPRQPAIQWPVSSKRTSLHANADGLASVTGHSTQFAADNEPARLPVRNVGAIVANPIVGPTGGNPGNLLVLDASKANAKSYAWDVIPLDKDKDGKPLTTILPWDSNGARAIVSSTPGTKTVILAVVDEGGKPTLWQWTIVVSGNVPTPVPPIPPDPEPPKPPTPQPTPTDGLRVLIVEETAERAKLPAAQLSVLFDKRVRDYMDAKCPRDAAMNRPAWNIWDQNVGTKDVPQFWQDAMKRSRGSVPWIAVFNGKTGVPYHEGPLPANVGDTLALLKKYGGE